MEKGHSLCLSKRIRNCTWQRPGHRHSGNTLCTPTKLMAKGSQATHTLTHTHPHIYVEIYICVYVYKIKSKTHTNKKQAQKVMANCTDQAAPWPAKGFVLVLSLSCLSCCLSACPAVPLSVLVSVLCLCGLPARWLVGSLARRPLLPPCQRGLFAVGQKENGVALIYFKWLMVLTCLAAFKAYDLWILDSKPAHGRPPTMCK